MRSEGLFGDFVIDSHLLRLTDVAEVTVMKNWLKTFYTERKSFEVDNMCNIYLELPGQIYKGNALALNELHGSDALKYNEEIQKPVTAL